MESIHGHEVIHMIQQAAHPFSRTELITAIGNQFGHDARFHTCSEDNLSADGLIDFLVARGKFIANMPTLAIDPTKVCQH